MKEIKPGDTQVHAQFYPILSDERIFGVNLYEAGLGERTPSEPDSHCFDRGVN